MQGFPFDSQLTFDGDNLPVYDRAVSSQPLRKLIRSLFTTGVMPNPSTNLQVSSGTDGMTVQVQAGFAVVDGGLCQETETRTLEVTAADTTYDRIDTVVLRWNENVDARTADLYVVAGTPSATPVRPTLQRDNSIYEIGLADVFVTKRVATITDDKITDTRYESERCGIVSSVSEWDTTTIYQQVQADLAGFKATEQAEFMEWFETIQNILDESTAGHLQSEIDEINQNLQADDGSGNTLDFKFSTDGTDYGYLDENGDFVPFRTRHTETFSPTSRANNLDMGLYHKKRYVDTTAVPNINTETYVAGNSNQTVDMGAANNYRYVNLYNAWLQGVQDADNRADPNTVNYQTGYNNGRASINLGVVKVMEQGSALSFNVAVGDILVIHNVVWGNFSISGANIIVDNRVGNAPLVIAQATSTVVTATNNGMSTLHVWRVYRS